MAIERIQAFIEAAVRQNKNITPELLANWSKVSLEIAKSELEEWESKRKESQAKPSDPIKKKSQFHIHNLSNDSIKALCLIISLFAMARSFGYIVAWFPTQDFMAIMTSLTIIMSYTVFPQAAISMIKKNLPISIGLFLLSLVVIIFSMGATISAIWNERSVQISSQIEASNDASKNANLLAIENSKLSRLNEDYSRIESEIRTLLSQRDKEESLSSAYNRLDSKVKSSKEALSLKNNEIVDSEKIIKSLTEKTASLRRGDFVSSSGLEVWFYIALSVIVDLAGPAAMSIALFL